MLTKPESYTESAAVGKKDLRKMGSARPRESSSGRGMNH